MQLPDTFENTLESSALTREPKDNIGENPPTEINNFTNYMCNKATN